jgi:phosphohistidine phosphatase
MKLVVIRHGQAGDRAEWQAAGKDDRQRPLTPEGKKQMRRAIAGLAALVSPIHLIATSPLVRAVQSAEIVASQYDLDLVEVPALEPDRDPEETVQWLKEASPDQTVAIVGHEPHLSTLIGFLLTGKSASFVVLKKSGVALIELKHPPRPGGGVLEGLLSPRVLRRLAD